MIIPEGWGVAVQIDACSRDQTNKIGKSNSLGLHNVVLYNILRVPLRFHTRDNPMWLLNSAMADEEDGRGVGGAIKKVKSAGYKDRYRLLEQLIFSTSLHNK
jgi:hypothetical protein